MLNTNKLILVRYKIRFLVLWFCIITFGFSATRPVAVMSKIIGDVKVDPVTDPGWRSATWGGKLFDGDQLQTGEAVDNLIRTWANKRKKLLGLEEY